MQESSPTEPDIITIEQERREFWFKFKNDPEIEARLTELLKEVVSNIDLFSAGEFKLSRMIDNYIHSSYKYPWPIIVESYDRDTEGKIIKINCSTNSISKDDEPSKIEFSISI